MNCCLLVQKDRLLHRMIKIQYQVCFTKEGEDIQRNQIAYIDGLKVPFQTKKSWKCMLGILDQDGHRLVTKWDLFIDNQKYTHFFGLERHFQSIDIRNLV